jgi:YHS domain-containing protein
MNSKKIFIYLVSGLSLFFAVLLLINGKGTELYLIVDCKNEFLRKNRPQIEKNNTSIQSEGKGLKFFCSPKELEKYGLQPIPYQQMGPVKNKWAKTNL